MKNELIRQLKEQFLSDCDEIAQKTIRELGINNPEVGFVLPMGLFQLKETLINAYPQVQHELGSLTRDEFIKIIEDAVHTTMDKYFEK
ncbi:hypothetical protein [Dysgonomonas termitidis]|jgi:hypothetical protein|uniref:Competence protein ComFB n=1 Tax=Dysgonomonas termitidis TaxID=1516126 RepID=A0ABV9L1G6_9BACT